MDDVRPDAVDIAAKAAGLRPDQVRAAVTEYRTAAQSLEHEPEWRASMHMHGKDWGGHTYLAEGTEVALQIEEWKERGEWKGERCYVFKDKPYELYSEARAVELALRAQPKPRAT